MDRPDDERLRKHERLRLQRDFDRVFSTRCRTADELLAVYVARNDLPWSRLGIRVGRGIGNAVRRNRVRRRIREAFRRQKHQLPKGFDIVCAARYGALHKSRDVRASLRRLVLAATRRLTALQTENTTRPDPDVDRTPNARTAPR